MHNQYHQQLTKRSGLVLIYLFAIITLLLLIAFIVNVVFFSAYSIIFRETLLTSNLIYFFVMFLVGNVLIAIFTGFLLLHLVKIIKYHQFLLKNIRVNRYQYKKIYILKDPVIIRTIAINFFLIFVCITFLALLPNIEDKFIIGKISDDALKSWNRYTTYVYSFLLTITIFSFINSVALLIVKNKINNYILLTLGKYETIILNNAIS